MAATRRGFYPVAALSGLSFGVLAVAVPLHVAAMHRPASLAGQLLASVTVAVALAALAAGVVGRMVGSARNLLVASVAVSGCGQAVLLAASSTTWMVVGTALVGAGIGLFWVSSQTLLGRSSGGDGSERAFAHHYAAYTLGVAGGSAIVGSTAAILRHAGIGEADAIQLSYGLGLAAMLAGLALWRPRRQRDAVPRGLHPRTSPQAVAVQLPDLLLISALEMMLPLTPIVLLRDFHLAQLVVGLTVACVQAGKIGGAFAGRIITRESGHRRAILLLLGAGAVLSLALCASTSALGAPLFVLALIATSFVATGAWPLIVDSGWHASSRIPGPT
jgi:MFS family permease